MNNIKIDSVELRLIISFLTLITPFILLISRSLDDNRLTSWKWVFTDPNIPLFFLLFLLALIAAFLCATISLGSGENRYPVFLFISSFALSTLFWHQPEVIIDVSRYFTQAKYLETHGLKFFFDQWGYEIFAWTDLPLVPLLYGLIFKFFGESRFFIQILTSLFFSGTVLTTYYLGKTLWDEKIGFYGGLFLFGFPYLFTQIPLMLVDVPTMFFVLFALYTFIKALTKGTIGSIFLASAAFFMAFFSKYSAWLLLSVLGVASLVYLKSDPILTLKRTCAVALLTFTLIVLVVLPNLEVITTQVAFLFEYQKPGLARWGETLISTFLFQTHPFITAAAIFSIIAAIKRKDSRFLIISYLIILVLIVMQIKRIRYTLPLFPLIALMASFGIREIRSEELKKFFVLCVVNSSLALALGGFLPFLKTMSDVNLLAAGKYLNFLEGDSVEVYTNPIENPRINPIALVPLLDYYTDKNIVYIGGKEPEITLDKVKKSSLRFTWEYPLPDYYQSISQEKADILVIISTVTGQNVLDIPPAFANHYKTTKHFQTNTGLFRQKIIVSVLHNIQLKKYKHTDPT